MKRIDSDALKRYFLFKYREMGIDPTPIEELRSRLKKKMLKKS